MSALQFHGIGTQLPPDVWLAVDRPAARPTSTSPGLRVVRLSGKAFSEGVETKGIDGVTAQIYTPAKTIVDCFKFRNKVGLDVALEALREGWRMSRVTMKDLALFSKVCRVEKIMRPYLESLGWRYLPADVPLWQTVYGVFRRWKQGQQWAALNDALRHLVRKDQDRRPQPTAAVLDIQSVKSASHGGPVGYDAGKRIKGRKLHLLVDTLGLVLGVVVTPADTTERDGGKAVLGRVLGWLAALRLL